LIISICLFTLLYFYFRDNNEFRDDFKIRRDWLETQGCACYNKITDVLQRTPNKSFIRHKLISDTSFVILWGDNSSELRLMNDTVFCQDRADEVPSLIDENEEYLVLQNRCGSECAEYHFLPLIDTLEYRSYSYVIKYDLPKHVVISIDHDSTISGSLKIQNFMTGSSKKMELD